MDLQKLIDQFNSGEEVETVASGGGDYREVTIEVKEVKFFQGDIENKNKYLQDSESLYIKLLLKAEEDGTEFEEYQKLKLSDDGKIKNWYFERFETSDGDIVPTSLCADVLIRAEQFDPKQRKEVKGMPLSREKLEGLKFKLEIRDWVNADGVPVVISRFDRQLAYEEQREKQRMIDNDLVDDADLDEPAKVSEDVSASVDDVFDKQIEINSLDKSKEFVEEIKKETKENDVDVW